MSEIQIQTSPATLAARIAQQASTLPVDLISSVFPEPNGFEDLVLQAAETLDDKLIVLLEQRMATTPLPLILALLTEYTIDSFFLRPSSKALPNTIARVQKLVSIIHRLGEYDASVVLVTSIAGRAAQNEDLTAMHAGRHLQKALTMPVVLELLFERLEDPQHYSSRPSILNYLQAISEIGLNTLLGALNTVREKETRSLLIKVIAQNQIPEPEQLLKSMRQSKPVVMLDYFDLAPHVSTEVLASLMLVALEQDHPALIMRVLRLLSKFPPGAADKILSKHLDHTVAEVRIVAYQVAALRKSQACRATLRLKVLSEDIWQLGTKEVRALTCAFAAISELDSVSALSKLLKPKIFQKKNVDVQLAAAFALSQLNDPKAKIHIEKAAKSMNAKIREGCKRALAPGAGQANLAATLGQDFVEKGFIRFEPNQKDWLQRVIDKQRKEKNLLVENAQGFYEEDPRDTRTEDELFANVLKPHNEPDELPTNLVNVQKQPVEVAERAQSQTESVNAEPSSSEITTITDETIPVQHIPAQSFPTPPVSVPNGDIREQVITRPQRQMTPSTVSSPDSLPPPPHENPSQFYRPNHYPSPQSVAPPPPQDPRVAPHQRTSELAPPSNPVGFVSGSSGQAPQGYSVSPHASNMRPGSEIPQWESPPPGWTAPSQEFLPRRPVSNPGSQPNLPAVNHQQIQQHREQFFARTPQREYSPQHPQQPEIPAGREPARRKLSDDFKKSKFGDRPPTRDGQRAFSVSTDPRFKK